MSNSSPEIQDENLIKILVATDCHLGVHEKDVMRGLFKIDVATCTWQCFNFAIVRTS